MIEVGLVGDESAQQNFHTAQVARTLGHHGLLVEVVGLVGEAFNQLAIDVKSVVKAFELTQQLGFGHELAAGVFGPAVGQALYQAARFIHPALFAHHNGSAYLGVKELVGVVNAVEPSNGLGKLIALLGQMRQLQVGLRLPTLSLLSRQVGREL